MHTVTVAFLKRLGHPALREIGKVVKLRYPVNGTSRYVDCRVVEDDDQRSGWQDFLSIPPGHLTIAWSPVQDENRRDLPSPCWRCSIALPAT